MELEVAPSQLQPQPMVVMDLLHMVLHLMEEHHKKHLPEILLLMEHHRHQLMVLLAQNLIKLLEELKDHIQVHEQQHMEDHQSRQHLSVQHHLDTVDTLLLNQLALPCQREGLVEKTVLTAELAIPIDIRREMTLTALSVGILLSRELQQVWLEKRRKVLHQKIQLQPQEKSLENCSIQVEDLGMQLSRREKLN